MNTAIYAPTGVFSGTGFAIPINDCMKFLADKLGRKFSTPIGRNGMPIAPLPDVNIDPGVQAPVSFGIEAVPVDDVIARQFGVQAGEGILVNRVIEKSPADAAGIHRGDIITAIAGMVITGTENVPKIVSHFRPGDNINVQILREGSIIETVVQL